jgi:Rha family phage regulatory protein
MLAALAGLDIVILDNGKTLRTTSLDIAEKFRKLHKNVLRDIEGLECSKEFTRLNFEPSEYQDSTGRTLPMYLITRDGFSMLAMGFTGKKAVRWKEAYINAFNLMEQRILQLATDRERRAARDWQESRTITKEQRKELTNTIRDILIPHARSQGSTAPESKIYMSYSKMIKSRLFSDPEALPKEYREQLTIRQLNILAVAESLADGVIQEEAEKGTPYKGQDGIFEKVKSKIIQYAETVGVLRLGEPDRLSIVRRASGKLEA